MTTRKGRALRTFSDAGTGETFEGGKDHTFEAGAYANYRAAGLVKPARRETSSGTGSKSNA